jgi:hypothetical protein
MEVKNIIFSQESGKSCLKLIEDITPLLRQHFKEISHYQDILLNPDFDHYLEAEKFGALRCYTARANDSLIGYCIFFIKNNPHYKSSKQAIQDVLYVDPRERGFGMKFISWCDSELKKEGVQVVYHHVKMAHDFGPALEKQGYEFIEKIYGKRLDKEK